MALIYLGNHYLPSMSQILTCAGLEAVKVTSSAIGLFIT